MNRFVLMIFAVFAPTLLVIGAAADSLDAALANAVARRKQTVGEAQKYAYSEPLRNLKWDSKGKRHLRDYFPRRRSLQETRPPQRSASLRKGTEK
jgi:flavin-binding protein dodecin